MIEIPPPKKRQLAKYNQRDYLGFPGSESALQEHTDFWRAERQRAFDAADLATYDMSNTILETTVMFTETWHETYRRPVTDRSRERSRRTLLNAMALGALLRESWSEEITGVPAGDAKVAGRAETILDIYVDRGMPLDFRIHTPTIREEDAPAEVWYRTDNLYVRQVRPMEPTEAVAETLQAHRVSIEADQLETLYPYIPSTGLAR